MIHNILSDKKLVLASHSPRRKLLLEMLGLNPLVIPSQVHEPITSEAPFRQVMRHAANKAAAVAALLPLETVVVAADTIVVLNKQILGKPDSPQEAKDHLKLLSGNIHKVYTGICLTHKGKTLCAHERSSVEFAPLSEAEIESYVATREPLDKAGAYGIQGYGSQFIRHITGCYFNVMGFPIHLFYNMISDMFREDT